MVATMKLYPEIEPYDQFYLDVGKPHTLYVEECGNADGVPVVFLHGGPGAGCEPHHRCYFNPDIYRIILFDQRGCGRSRPHAELTANTTWDLVADMEQIRQQLGIEQWVLFGGSWGSTLALAYAEQHPQRVSGLVLRGIFLARQQDIDWFYQQGTSRLFPDYWQAYLGPIPEDERDDMVHAYYRQLTSDNKAVRERAARAWSVWEGMTATLLPNEKVVDHFADPHAAMSIARIECHYFVNQSFLEPDQLVRNAHRLKNIPGYIIHGRYDVICPVEQAWALHEAWPEARLTIVPDAGHSVVEPGITQALLQATEELGELLKR